LIGIAHDEPDLRVLQVPGGSLRPFRAESLRTGLEVSSILASHRLMGKA
jgi:hypothetical protein